MAGKNNKNGYGKGTFVETRMFLSEAFLSLGQPGTAPFISSVSAQVLIMFLESGSLARVRIKRALQFRNVRTKTALPSPTKNFSHMAQDWTGPARGKRVQ
jgi:hypothetical protein